MEKTIDLTPKEIQAFTFIEQDGLRLGHRWSVLRREMDEIDKRIQASDESQRSFIRRALSDRGVEQFQQARMEPGKIICTLLEEMPPSTAIRPNGGDFKEATELAK